MKTQRPRGSADQRPTPDMDRLDGDSYVQEDSDVNGDLVESASARALPPTLPKRKHIRPVAPESKAAAVLEHAELAAPAQPAVQVATRPPVLTQPSLATRAWNAFITYENLIWFGIFAIAVISRFYDVGSRALHHDESLHAVYSRNLYSGIGYQHDPMMHGPLQFHYIAIMFWLFGTSDSTVRFASIFCGLFVVMSPFFLRRQMGRLTAIICSGLLLVSPAVLYFSRMAREDAIYSGMEMIMIVGLWRFLSTRRPADFFIFSAGLSLMFTIKESAYLTVAVLGVLFLFLFAFQSGWAILGATLGYTAIMGVLGLIYRQGAKNPTGTGLFSKLPDIPNTNPDYNTIKTFAGSFLAHPLILIAITATVVYAVALIALFMFKKSRMDIVPRALARSVPVRATNSGLPARRVRPGASTVAAATVVNGTPTVDLAAASTNGHEAEAVADSVTNDTEAVDTSVDDNVTVPGAAQTLWNPRQIAPRPGTLFARYQEGSLPHLLGALMTRPSVLLIGFALFSVIFVAFYSVFFTDVPRGILSGMFGSLGYWMGQQGVRRGDQPWFYYFLIVPLYQPVAVFFSLCSAAFFSWRGVRWLITRLSTRRTSEEPGLGAFNIDRAIPFARFDNFLPLFLGWWLLGTVAVYSWAGEKMPWLIMHITRPAIFFASLFIGALVTSLITRRRMRLASQGLWEGESRGAQLYPANGRGFAGARFSLGGIREARLLALHRNSRNLHTHYLPTRRNSAARAVRRQRRCPSVDRCAPRRLCPHSTTRIRRGSRGANRARSSPLGSS